jgi:hypothetical protein
MYVNPVATQTFPTATVPVSGLQRLHRFIQQQNDFSPGDGSVPAEDFFCVFSTHGNDTSYKTIYAALLQSLTY